MMEEFGGGNRKRARETPSSDDSFDEGVIGISVEGPTFHSTPISRDVVKRARHSLGEPSLNDYWQKRNSWRDDGMDSDDVKEEEEEDDDDIDHKSTNGTGCSWLHQNNMRNDRCPEHLEMRSDQFERAVLTPFVSNLQKRRTPSLSNTLTASSASQSSGPSVRETSQDDRSLRASRSSSLNNNSSYALNESFASEERLSMIFEESISHKNDSLKRHIPTSPERTFDVSNGTILQSHSPKTVAWNKRMNYLVFQWETGIALWTPTRYEVRIVHMTTDIGYECKINQMAWNQSYTTLAMVSCKGDLMLWSCLTDKKARGRPLEEATIKFVAWKAFVPEKEDKETLYTMTKQGMLFEFKVLSTRVEPVRCIRTCLKDPSCLTISSDSNYVACSNNKGTIEIWKTGDLSLKSTKQKDLGELHSWCPWLAAMLVTVSHNKKTLTVYNMNEKSVTHTSAINSEVTSMSWSRDFEELITAEGSKFVCRTFPAMEEVISVNARRPVMFLDVREEEDSCLVTFDDRGLVCTWRCFDCSNSRLQVPNARVQARRQARTTPRSEESVLDIACHSFCR